MYYLPRLGDGDGVCVCIMQPFTTWTNAPWYHYSCVGGVA